MPDGATVTFDVYECLAEHPTKGDYTMLICPGIANSSESLYIRTMVDYAQNNGFRVSVLNHLGALKDVPLTAPRIYTYGGTEEYEMMVHYVRETYPDSKLVGVGCSMGANILTKYLGMDKKNQDFFICAMSLCQGYDVNSCVYQNQATDIYSQDMSSKYLYQRVWPYLLKWEHLRRFYIFMMTLNQIRVMKQHADVLFSEKALKKYDLDLDKIYASTSLHYLDEVYSRRRAGFDNLEEYYKWSSSASYLPKIDIPMLILNAHDDVIVPDVVFDIPLNHAYTHDKSLFVVTKHGGHLGFFEGQEKNWIMPQSVTWLDKIVLDYSNAVINVTEYDH
ncbi:monoacylglycerol lipase ABHD2-like [Lineus longissimus]|uniref:monoacylglycerol lipase ABHD2-like n=1 Tax=Lineus longissimus TaxID=88925 RepID=UPI00315DEE1A